MPVSRLFIRHRNLMQPSWRLEQFPRPRTISRTNQSIALHQIEQGGCTPVADAQTARQQRGGRLAKFEDKPYCVVEHGVVFFGVTVRSIHVRAFIFWRLEEPFGVLRGALVLPESHDGCRLLLANVRSMQAHQSAGAWGQKQHVATPKQSS